MDIEEIQGALVAGAYDFREHARLRMRRRGIEAEEVIEAVLSGEIIEEYPGHSYGPCCLVYGHTVAGRPLHVVLSLPPLVSIITTYEPDPAEWVGNRIRRVPQ